MEKMKKHMLESAFTLILFSVIVLIPKEGYSATPQVAAGENHTVGLKSDGTVVVVGSNYYGQLNVSSWSNITQVAAASGPHTVGNTDDSTVVGVGYYAYGWLKVYV